MTGRPEDDATASLTDSVPVKPGTWPLQKVSSGSGASGRRASESVDRTPAPIAATVIGTNLVIDYGSEEAARAALDAWPSAGLDAAARSYVTAKRTFDKKWRQDNCPERGDFHRWYADKAVAQKALTAKFDALAARPTQASDSPEKTT